MLDLGSLFFSPITAMQTKILRHLNFVFGLSRQHFSKTSEF